MRKWVPALVVAAAGLVAFGASGLFGRAPKVVGEKPVPRVSPGEVSSARTIGVGGCASAGCHGGSAARSLAGTPDEGSWNGTAAHWLAVDPHTKAYDALKSKLAADIMARYAPNVHATDDVRCLACHTNPSVAGTDASERERLLRADGVSCEACHGDAGRWMSVHTTWTRENRAAGYKSSGMTKLFDIGERAAMCMGCHVGAPADPIRGYPVRDMNHDMIAAGHPRLNFDFADWQRRLPPHWLEEDRTPEFEVKSFIVGRAAQTEVAKVLKQDRAKRGKDGTAPMPEFADWRCVSCHHKLGEDYPSAGSKPTDAVVWPKGLDRVKFAAAPGSECAAAIETQLKAVDVSKLDHDTAGQVYHGLAARERMRMKRDNRQTYDAGFDALKELLKQPRGNLDFKLKDGTAKKLSELLK